MNSQVMYHNVPTPPGNVSLAAAAPDGGLLYAGIRCINYISAPPASGEQPQVVTMSTRINILALDVSPMWANGSGNANGNPAKPFAIVGDDLSVQVWDCGLGEAIIGHKAHQHQHEARDVRAVHHTTSSVLMSYLANGNILSMDASDLVIYCVASNTYCRRPTFISPRNHQLTMVRCSPYNDNLFAVGTAMGNVLVCDLRKMNIVYKFHGHKAPICGLAWREVPAPQEENLNNLASRAEQWRSRNGEQNEKPKAKPPPLSKSRAAESDDLFDIYNFDHLECEFGAPVAARRQSSEDCGGGFVGLEKPAGAAALDFVEACESVKADLLANRQAENTQHVEVTLTDCEPTKPTGPLSDASTISNKHDFSDSTEGSLEVIQYSSSSDDAVIVDGEAAKPKREVLHHIYHQAEVHASEAPLPKTEPASNLQVVPAISTETISSASGKSSRLDTLLVSIDGDEVMMIWNTNTGAHAGKNYSKSKAAGKLNNVYWLNDQVIVSLSRHQLFFWSLEFERKMLRYKISRDRAHSCQLQDIVSFSCDPSKEMIWLCRNNRQIGMMNPLTGQVSAFYGTVAFGVRAMAECPDDMNKIALGCSDRRVAFFDISKLSSSCLPIDSVYVTSNVYSLAWSPNCLELAFGTFDGTVGILDVERMKVKTHLRTPHKKEVYSLVWQDHYIYFIVNRVFGFFDLSRSKTDPIVVNCISRPSYLSVRGSFLFVGTDDGLLQLHERDSGMDKSWTPFIRQSALFARYVTDIAWSPLDSNVFAVAGNDKFVYVMEFQQSERKWITQHTFTANAEKASITSLKWSHTQKHLLLTFHIEGKVCLWNCNEPEKPPLTITYHCPMWCGMFLPTDENIIMCSGKALSVELLNIKDALSGDERNICPKVDALLNVKWASKSLTQPFAPALTAADKKRQRRDQRKAAVKPEVEPVATKEVKKIEVNETPVNDTPANETPVEELLGALSLDKKTNKMNTRECTKCKEREANLPPDSFLTHSRTCLYLAQKELNKSALEKLAIVLTEDAAKIDKSVLMSKLFSTKVMAKELIATELTNLKQSNTRDIAPLCLALSTFKLREELEQHMANKTLTEWHLSVAPSVSFTLWQDCCRAYAKQMEEKGFIMHAATYLFSLGMQSEAIDLFLANEYYKEALVHARICLPATDPLIKTIINRWLENLEGTGNFAAAALICVLDNEMLRGYSYLRKFRNCTPEIAELMDQIKRIGQLSGVLDGCAAIEPIQNGSTAEH
ncbi:LOW QUALITY PROTEIN: protein rigor mortis [Drosophila gunungcola]|uniref:LOW QUALITY PROTEIN: protein rigor mortis n=1 Tax=Drosophila gunungcola TaxID=103775 RepID=UPI0022E22B96|nr:LOW QUALITY PROTEIN: protein rigor mortis [Drosophila gunungcola]